MDRKEKARHAFSFKVRTDKTIEESVQELTSRLKDAGFGILGILNFREILQKKGLGFDGEYRLLEVCKPDAAKEALETDPDVGLLLPCTIAVYQKDKQTWISLARPTALLANLESRELDGLGREIERDLVSILEAL